MRADHQALARAGRAGEAVQPRPQLDPDIGDHGEVGNVQFAEHGWGETRARGHRPEAAADPSDAPRAEVVDSTPAGGAARQDGSRFGAGCAKSLRRRSRACHPERQRRTSRPSGGRFGIVEAFGLGRELVGSASADAFCPIGRTRPLKRTLRRDSSETPLAHAGALGRRAFGAVGTSSAAAHATAPADPSPGFRGRCRRSFGRWFSARCCCRRSPGRWCGS